MTHDFYTPEVQGPYELASLGEFTLEDGGVIPDLQLAYTTFGELNAAKDNAICIPTWFSGTHETWARVYVGPGRALDPERWFIVVVNQIGSGLSTSPHNAPDPIARSAFPRVRIGDDVRAQERLLRETWGIERLALVAGGSMGAQQAYEWAVRFPDQVQRCAPIAGTARITPHDELYTQALMDAITSDPAWAGGEYADPTDVADGLRRHAGIWAVMGLTTEFWRTEFWREVESPDGVPFTSTFDFQRRFLEASFAVMDPGDLVAMAWKWQHADVARHTGGDLAAALGRITALTSVIPIETDMFFPPGDCAVEQAMIPGSRLRVLPGIAGHFSVHGFQQTYLDTLDGYLRELLDTPV